MDAGLRRHDDDMAVVANIVAFSLADIVNEAAMRPKSTPL